MEASIISPTGLLDRYSKRTDYHLCLAHLIYNDSHYRNWYQDRIQDGDFVILDNSVIELGRPVSLSELADVAKMIRPSEIVLPDWPADPLLTLNEAREGAPILLKTFRCKIMAVPQGKTVDEWMWSHEQLCHIDEVTTIGIGKFLKEVRPDVVRELDRARDPNRDYHLLGTWGNPIEVRGYDQSAPWLRGVDTKLPVRLGQRGIALHPDLGMLSSIRPEPLDFTISLDPLPIITENNVNLFLSWAAGSKTTTWGQVIPLHGEGTESQV